MSRERIIRWIRIVAAVAFAVAVLAAVALFTLTRYALPWLTSQVAKSAGYQFSARSMDFHMREGIVLKDVRVAGPDGHEIFKTHRLTIRPRWSALIRHRLLIVEELSADIYGGRLVGRGQASRELDVDATIEFRSLSQGAQAAPTATIRALLIHGRGDITATIKHDQLQASATAQVDVPAKTIKGMLTVGPYRWQENQPHPWDIAGARAQWRGSFSRWDVQARANLSRGSFIRYGGTIEKTDQEWRIGWDTLVWHVPPETNWRVTRPGVAVVEPDGGIRIPDLRLSDGTGRMQFAVSFNRVSSQSLSLHATHVALAPLAAWFDPAQKIRGNLDGTLDLKGSFSAPTGGLDVVVSSGSIKGFAFGAMRAKARLESQWIILEKLALGLPETGKNIMGNGRIPWHLVQSASPNRPLELHLQADDIDPQEIAKFVPGLDIESGGHIAIKWTVQGLYPKLDMEGRVSAQVPEIRYPDAGLELKDLDLELLSQGRRAEIKRGQAKLGKGSVTLSGHIDWPHLDITLTADKASLSIPKKLELRSDARIHLGGTFQSPELTGSISPREGSYTVRKTSRQEKEQKASRKPSMFWTSLQLDVTAEWPHGLWYREGLTKIETSGDLRIRKASQKEELIISGPLSLLRGSYDAYGRDFIIQSGDLRFMGTPGINPTLNIQAQYRTRDVTINLSVLGTAEHPLLKFTSSPSMTEQEIISTLVTGHTSSAIGSSSNKTDTSDQAKVMAADVASSYLTKELRSSGMDMGLDVVRVTPSATGTVWTVGRYLGPDLFVSYGQSPKDAASSVVNADYSLSRRWSLATQASSTSDTFVDLLFRYPLKKRPVPKKGQ